MELQSGQTLLHYRLADKIGEGAVFTGQAVANGQTGRLQLYIGSAVVVTVALLFLFLKLNG